MRDHNLPEATGVGAWPRNRRDGNRVSTNMAYLLDIRDRENLEIRHDTLVDRVIVEDGRARSVRLANGEQVESRRVILSAGAAVSPAILLRSGIGPREKLDPHGIAQRVALPGVGENLTDHFGTGIQAFPVEGLEQDPDVVTEVGVRYTSPGSDQFNDMQLAISTIWDGDQVRGLTDAPRRYPSFGIGAVIQRPKTRGRLSLRSADPNDQPELDMQYASDPEDLRRLMLGARLCWEIINSDAIAPSSGASSPPPPKSSPPTTCSPTTSAAPPAPPGTSAAPAAWAAPTTRSPSSISRAASSASTISPSPTPQSCPTSSPATPTSPRS